MTSGDASQPAPWAAHAEGGLALLESSEPNQIVRQGPGTVPSTLLVFQMLIDCMVAGKQPTLTIPEYRSVIGSIGPQGPLLDFMHRTACISAAWKGRSLACEPGKDLSWNLELVGKSQTLDEEIENFMQERFEARDVTVVENNKLNVAPPLQSLFAMPGAPKQIFCCDSPTTVYQWHLFRACRLTVLRVLWAAIDKANARLTTEPLRANNELIKDLIRSRIDRSVDELLAMVYATLSAQGVETNLRSATDIQGYKALQLLWPLHTAGTCLMSMAKDCPTSVQRLDWVKALFRFIRDDLGVQTANRFPQLSDGLYAVRTF